MYKPIVAILLGDGAGVGPEIVADLIGRRFFDTLCRPIIIGDKTIEIEKDAETELGDHHDRHYLKPRPVGG